MNTPKSLICTKGSSNVIHCSQMGVVFTRFSVWSCLFTENDVAFCTNGHLLYWPLTVLEHVEQDLVAEFSRTMTCFIHTWATI